MYCFKCGEPVRDGSRTCNNCGATQPNVQQPQYRQVPPPQNRAPQQAAEMPASYYVDSWILFTLCMLYGIIRAVIGVSSGNETHIYKGIVACCAACVFIPAIKVMNNATGTLLIKLAVAIVAIILI